MSSSVKFVLAAFASLILQGTAQAQCSSKYRFTWDSNTTGMIDDVKIGETCRVPVFIRGDTNLEEIEIVRRPKGVKIEQESTSLLLTADKSFSGGKMLVRFHGVHSRTKQARRSDVEFDILLRN